MKLLAFAAFALVLDAGQPQQMHRWRDAQGNEHVTTTSPPKGATPMGVPSLENTREKDPARPGAATLSLKEERAAIEATMNDTQKTFWQTIEGRIRKARSAGDIHALQKAADTILFDALWGQGLWAVMGLPLVLMAMGILFGWWLGSGRKRPIAAFLLFMGVICGLAVSHLALARFLYRAQSQRLRSSMTLLPHYLGAGASLRADNHQVMLQHIQGLETAVLPTAPPWAFPMEVVSIQESLRRVVANP